MKDEIVVYYPQSTVEKIPKEYLDNINSNLEKVLPISKILNRRKNIKRVKNVSVQKFQSGTFFYISLK